MRFRLRDERGFTLIELMVVVMIIGVLIAIAIPVFLGARGRAQDRAAQSSLRNALAAAKSIYANNQNYDSIDPTTMEAAEPSFTYVDGSTDSTGPGVVSVVGAGDVFAASAKSDSQKIFAIADSSADGGTFYAMGDLHTLGYAMGPGGMGTSEGFGLVAAIRFPSAGDFVRTSALEGGNPYDGTTSAMYMVMHGSWSPSWTEATDSFAGEGSGLYGQIT
jgi:type IV pilus assembly protein PilA